MRSSLLAALTAVASVAILALVRPTPLPAQTAAVDHGAYDALLRRHVANGLVDYDAFARDSAFGRYLASLDRVDPSLLSTEERLAFWINVYNAYTIRLITSHGERESIRNINKTLGFLRLKGPWNEPIVRAAGRRMTLDEVQHGMIRRESSDPRVHFALSCGAMSCPPLRDEAYTGARLEQQLHDQGTRFLLGDTTRNRFDVKTRTFHRNILFHYYASDFGESRRELGQFLLPWYGDTTKMIIPRVRAEDRPPLDTTQRPVTRRDSVRDSIMRATFTAQDTVSATSLLTIGRFRLIDRPFDWSLNAQRGARGARATPPQH